MNQKNDLFFRTILLKWFATNKRPMPWKGEKNPYYIWLSEIILQQTRVEQGLPYFLKFKQKYPRIQDLAKAPEDEVMKLWEGLGYYSRARNLHYTAKLIANEFDGIFPTTYESILALKGVGVYTAAAIASFAYNLPYAVVDGNVYRVLARFFGIKTPIDSTAGKKEFQELAQRLLHPQKAGNYNQAIMDFGATFCLPKKPKCASCPFQEQCVAFQRKEVSQLPVKAKKLQKRNRYFNYYILEKENEIYLRKRIKKDIWQNLYEFPMHESSDLLDEKHFRALEDTQNLLAQEGISLQKKSKVFKQTLSHQKIVAIFWKFSLPKHFDYKKENLLLVKRENFHKFAFPKIIDWYLQDNSLLLF